MRSARGDAGGDWWPDCNAGREPWRRGPAVVGKHQGVCKD